MERSEEELSAELWRQQLEPYFDEEYYLRSNPDIPAGADPYQHFMCTGWKEGRNPSETFDVNFYLTSYSDVSKNPLYHYVFYGRAEGRWASASSPPQNGIRRRTIRSTTTGIPLFSLTLVLCAWHAFRRRSVKSIATSEHAMQPISFVRLIASRYWPVRGKIRYLQQAYLMQSTSSVLSHDFLQRSIISIRRSNRLYLAGLLKRLGLFFDAEFLYRSVSKDAALQGLTLTGLADLYFLQAAWTREFVEYEAAGIVINLNRNEWPSGFTWLGRQFSQAIDTLSEAVITDPGNYDTWRLLAFAYLQMEMWTEALVCIRRCLNCASATTDDQACEGQALFGIDRDAGTAAFRRLFGNRGMWRVTDAEIVLSSALQNTEGVRYHETGPGTKLPVNSHIAHDGRIHTFGSEITFEASHVAWYDQAEVLPNFGMLLVNDKFLVADTLHHERCHWMLFTPSIRALAGNRALVCRLPGRRCDYHDHIFLGYNKNFYHWLIDEIPRLLSTENHPQFSKQPLLIDANAANWQIELLHRVGIEQSRLRKVDFRNPVLLNHLIVPSRLSTKMVAHPRAVRFVRDKLAPHADHVSPQPGKRLYLIRRSANTRRSSLLNERRVIEKFRRAGFQFVDPGTLTISQQIGLFAEAQVIAGPGGAAFANALFAPTHAKILELSSASTLCETFGSLASALGQEHWWCAGRSFPRSLPYWLWTTFDYEISEHDLDLCFAHLL